MTALRLLPDPAVEALIMPDTAAVIDVGRKREQRKVLAIHVVSSNRRRAGIQCR